MSIATWLDEPDLRISPPRAATHSSGTTALPAAHPSFGAGGTEPYASALRQNNPVVLLLHDNDRGHLTTTTTMDVARWNADADDVDLTLLRAVTGPVLDIGCGPGRMVRAAMSLGLVVLGIDVSPTAIELATETGLNVLERSVFDTVPAEGRWQTALLVDGNIGIGGDVAALLARCRDLLAPEGEIVAELHTDSGRDHSYSASVIDANGGQSDMFPWSEIGLTAVAALAPGLGLELRQAWVLGGRSFCRLAKTRR